MVLTILAASCDSNTTEKEVFQADGELQELISGFCNRLPGEDSRSGRIPAITSATVHHYDIVDNTVTEAPATRSGIGFDITWATLDFGATQGMAVVSTDERLNHVYYITENGCVADTANIPALRDLLNSIPEFAAAEILHPVENTRNEAEDVSVAPLVKFKWGQGYPYNFIWYACGCSSCKRDRYKGHRPIGCVTTAVAQTLATLGKNTGSYYGSRDIDFKNLPKTVDEFTYKDFVAQQVAQYFHEIAVGCQIKSGCSGSGGYTVNAYRYLTELGFDCDLQYGSINVDHIINNLNNGIPHLIAGVAGEAEVGHMWVVDGMSYNDRDGYTYHCNWGWNGQWNGWSYGNPYTCYGERDDKYESKTHYFAYPNNLQHIYINSK